MPKQSVNMLDIIFEAPATSSQGPSQNAVPFHICLTISDLRLAAVAAIFAAPVALPPSASMVDSSARPCAPKAFDTEVWLELLYSPRLTVSSVSRASGIQSTMCLPILSVSSRPVSSRKPIMVRS